MPRYGEASKESVKRAMKERKKGTLRSGRSGRRVTSRKQAVAIGLSEARERGAKVPARSKRSSSSRSSSSRSRTGGTRRTSARGRSSTARSHGSTRRSR